MTKFLGEVTVEQANVPEFKDFTKSDWAMYFVKCYGQIDGEHHKTWVLDQVARILKGSAIQIKKAKWDNGEFEYRVQVVEPSEEYKNWVREMRGDKDEEGEFEYDYDEGIEP